MQDHPSHHHHHWHLILASVVLGVGLAVAGYFIGDALAKAKRIGNTVTVKGLAERQEKADLAIWNLSFSVTGDDLQNAQKQAADSQVAITEFFQRNGFVLDEISISGLQVQDMMAESYTQANMREGGRFTVTGMVGLRTAKVTEVEKLSNKTGELINKGIVLTGNSGPIYKYTKLNEIKPIMLGEATQNAREAAQQFAKDSRTQVLGIANANQGLFSIEGIEGFEGRDDSSRAKKIRVVTTVTFYLGE